MQRAGIATLVFMGLIPFLSLATGLVFAVVAWLRRARFKEQPYHHWFIYLHMAAVGLHQFEEYGFPGHFRAFFVSVFGTPSAASVVPSGTLLELANVFGFATLFGLAGWLGTRIKWVGMCLLFVNFGNGFFHISYAVTRMTYVPGVITSTLFYLPLALYATRFAIEHHDVDGYRLPLAFALGTFVSFAPFLHVWAMMAIS